MEQSKYWELNTFQKAALSYQDIQAFRRVELMIKGVAIPQEPSESVNPPTFDEFAKGHATNVTMIQFGYGHEYQIDEADAEKLLSIQFRRIASKYVNGQSISYLGSGERPKIKKESIYPEFSNLYEKYQILYGDAIKRKQEWETYEKNLDAANKATEDLISDWNDAQEYVATYAKVKNIFNEFVQMTEGDQALARKFLEKQFEYDVINIFDSLSSLEKESQALPVA